MGWATQEVVLAADAALLLTVTIAIGYAIAVLRRLGALRAAQAEWGAQLAEFSARAEAAEAGFARMRATLEAERGRREGAPADAKPEPEPLELTEALADPAAPADPVAPAAPPVARRPLVAGDRSILSMQ